MCLDGLLLIYRLKRARDRYKKYVKEGLSKEEAVIKAAEQSGLPVDKLLKFINK
jgi:hypothetical protein